MFIYCADVFCDDCGAAIAATLEPADDSDEYPQWAGEESTDGPSHCARGRYCLNRVDLRAYGLSADDELIGAEDRYIGALLPGGLTEHGVAYLLEMLNGEPRTAYQRALHRLWREEFADDIPRESFVVIESTPGYLPEDDDPATFDDYADAVAYLNERAAEYADDADGNYRVEYGIASSDNLAAVIVWDDDKSHDLGRVIEVLRDEN